jgi:hypothetical protein
MSIRYHNLNLLIKLNRRQRVLKDDLQKYLKNTQINTSIVVYKKPFRSIVPFVKDPFTWVEPKE